MLVTFGLSIILQNLLLEVFSADSQGLDAGRIENASIRLSDRLAVGWFPLLTLVTAVAVLVGLQLLLSRTQLGRSFRATSDDPEAASLVGLDHRHVFAMATAIALATVAVAGLFLGVRTTFTPSIGPTRLIFAFEAVIIGGLGSIWGTLVGGLVLGVAQALGAQLSPGWGSWPATWCSWPCSPSGPPACSAGRCRHEHRAAPALRVQRATLSSRIGLAVGLAAVVVLALGPLWALDSVLRTLISFLTLLALAQMWNLLAGYAGLVSIGQQAYVGLGAYALLLFADTLGLPLLASVLVAGVVGTLVAVPTALLAFRLRGGYFAIGTWVIAEVYRLVITNVSQLGGGSGLTLRAASAFDRTTRLYLTYELALAVGVGAVAGTYLLLRRRLGLALTAIRDSEQSAQSLGVPVFRAKLVAYLVAAFGCSLAGAVIYLNLLRVQPEAAFSVNWTAFMIFIVVIGGVGTIEGPIIGTIVFFVLQETLSGYGAWYLVLLGAVAVLVTLLARRGLWGLVADRTGWSLFPVQRRLEER